MAEQDSGLPAAETPEVQPEESGQETAAAQKEEVPAKTFTQAEVDDIVKRAKAKEYRKRERLARELDTVRGLVQPQTESDSRKGDAAAPREADFKTYEEFVAAIARHEAEQVSKRRSQEDQESRAEAAARREMESIEDNWAKLKGEGAKKYADFEEVITGDVPMTFAMARAVKESDIGHDIAYYLGKHPDEAEEIADMSTAAQIRAIGRIEGRLQSDPKHRPSRPAEPIRPVGARANAGNELSDNLDNDEWQRRRLLQKAERMRKQAGG